MDSNTIKNVVVADTNQQAQAKRAARGERRRDQTRAEILDVASEIVLRDGFASFTLAAVAEQLGLTNPALYYYFKSKEALLFELVRREWFACGEEVHAAVEATRSGADAVETLMRTVFERYRSRLQMFKVVHQMTSAELLGDSFMARDELERIRPVNEMFYGGTEARLRADQQAGTFAAGRDPRRFAFTAHMATVGVLNMKAMTDAADDPLIHGDEDLIADLCLTFRQAANSGAQQ